MALDLLSFVIIAQCLLNATLCIGIHWMCIPHANHCYVKVNVLERLLIILQNCLLHALCSLVLDPSTHYLPTCYLHGSQYLHQSAHSFLSSMENHHTLSNLST